MLQAVVDITPDQYPDIRKLMERCQVSTNLFLYLNLNKFLSESLSKEKQNKFMNLIISVIKKLVVYVSFSKEQSFIDFYVQWKDVLSFCSFL